jgi:thiol-disulfide isomerase/thioredoxin
MAMESGSPPAGRPVRRRVAVVALLLAAAAVLSTATLRGMRWAASPRPAASGPMASAARSGLGFVRVDRPAPAVQLPALRGRGTIDLTALAGKPIVLNFWASTCEICKTETPALASVARALDGKVTFLGIDTADQRGPAIAFLDRYQVGYAVGYDPAATAASHYGVPGLPVTYFLSSSGKTILGENIGALSSGELRVILRRLYRLT